MHLEAGSRLSPRPFKSVPLPFTLSLFRLSQTLSEMLRIAKILLHTLFKPLPFLVSASVYFLQCPYLFICPLFGISLRLLCKHSPFLGLSRCKPAQLRYKLRLIDVRRILKRLQNAFPDTLLFFDIRDHTVNVVIEFPVQHDS